MWRRETCLAPAGNPTATPRPSTQYPCHSLSHIRSFGAPTFMGTIRNTYKFVVGQPSDLDAKGTKTAVKQRNVKEYIGFNSLGIWSSGGALMNLVRGGVRSTRGLGPTITAWGRVSVSRLVCYHKH